MSSISNTAAFNDSRSRDLCRKCQGLHNITIEKHVIQYGQVSEVLARRECHVCCIISGLFLEDDLPTKSRNSNKSVNLTRQSGSEFTVAVGAITRGRLELFAEGEAETWRKSKPRYSSPNLHNANIDTIKSWMETCGKCHECEKDYLVGRTITSSRADFETYFVDINKGCLVRLPAKGVRFIALSYVRGATEMFQTTRKNIDLLQEPGTIPNKLLKMSPPLSRVIFDFMTFVRRLGEQYLWVDTLCIPQDDGPHKTAIISRMDLIYGYSTLTAIAASATDADSPLPGIGTHTRIRDRRYVELKSVSEGSQFTRELLKNAGFRRRQPPRAFVTVRPDLRSLLESCTYNTRGWTFQENLLSRRTVIFTPYQIFLHCAQSFESDGILQRDDKRSVRYLNQLFSAVREAKLQNMKIGDSKTGSAILRNSAAGFAIYQSIVRDYSRRRLTFTSDALAAISGILAVLEYAFRWTFRAGMPERVLHYAILWRPAGPLARNLDFPSWSWVGWTGPVDWGVGKLWKTDQGEDIGTDTITPPNIIRSACEFGLPRKLIDDRFEGPVQALQITSHVAPFSSIELRETVTTDRVYLVEAEICGLYKEIWAAVGDGKDRGLSAEKVRCGLMYSIWQPNRIPEVLDRKKYLGKTADSDEKQSRFELVELSRTRWEQDPTDFWFPQHSGARLSAFESFVCEDKRLPFDEYCLVDVMLIETKLCETRDDILSERITTGMIHQVVWDGIVSERKKVTLC